MMENELKCIKSELYASRMTFVGEEEAMKGKNSAKDDLEQLKRFLGTLRHGKKLKLSPRCHMTPKPMPRSKRSLKLAPT